MKLALVSWIVTSIAALLPIVTGPKEPLLSQWGSASRLTVDRAVNVLSLHAEGEPVSGPDLFEAEKLLRSDGGISAGEYVLGEVLTKLVRRRVGNSSLVRVRTLPPILHWLESAAAADGIRLRGESLQLAVLNASDDAVVTLLYHQTVFQDWRLCAGAPCFTTVDAPVRSTISYELSVPRDTASRDDRSAPRLAAFGLEGLLHSRNDLPGQRPSHSLTLCDPPPSLTPSPTERQSDTLALRYEAGWTTSERTNQIAAPGRSGSSRVAYRVGGVLAAPPASAARSAVVNNPLDFELFG